VAIVQNDDDAAALRSMGLADPAAVQVIRGSGVDLQEFRPAEATPTARPIVMLASRMLWDKGVGEFVEAARRLRAESTSVRFVLVGPRDEENPTAVSAEALAEWQRAGIVEWWGQHEDMANVLSQAAIVCLPSYREGLPKVLLEAAACAKPIVSTNVPGCRDVVEAGVTGFLVPPHDAAALAEALRTLLAEPALCQRMGQEAQRRVAARFGLAAVQAATLELYRKLGHRPTVA
jgi:glycosyltransferase involved in cell wall biosynthesis